MITNRDPGDETTTCDAPMILTPVGPPYPRRYGICDLPRGHNSNHADHGQLGWSIKQTPRITNELLKDENE